MAKSEIEEIARGLAANGYTSRGIKEFAPKILAHNRTKSRQPESDIDRQVADAFASIPRQRDAGATPPLPEDRWAATIRREVQEAVSAALSDRAATERTAKGLQATVKSMARHIKRLEREKRAMWVRELTARHQAKKGS